jgi:hypothetical protein
VFYFQKADLELFVELMNGIVQNITYYRIETDKEGINLELSE